MKLVWRCSCCFPVMLHSRFFFSSRRRHTRWPRDWSSDVCSSDLDRVAIEEDHWQSLDMAEDVAPQIAHHALAKQAGKHRLAVLAGEGDDERERENRRRPPHQC